MLIILLLERCYINEPSRSALVLIIALKNVYIRAIPKFRMTYCAKKNCEQDDQDWQIETTHQRFFGNESGTNIYVGVSPY